MRKEPAKAARDFSLLLRGGSIKHLVQGPKVWSWCMCTNGRHAKKHHIELPSDQPLCAPNLCEVHLAIPWAFSPTCPAAKG